MPTKRRQPTPQEAAPKPTPGFDFDFRPKSYWEDLGPMQTLLAPIKEEHRRRRIMEALQSGDDLPDGILDPAFPEDLQKALERIHPAYMGGAYLPALELGEVEIARVSLASVTNDVTSFRACRNADGSIGYRAVDEYDTEIELPIGRSVLPLTLQELFGQVDGASSDMEGGSFLTAALGFNLENDLDLETAAGFVTVTSSFYPELKPLCTGRIQKFVDAWAEEHGLLDENEDEDEDEEEEGEA